MKPLFVLFATGTALLGFSAGCSESGESSQIDTASALSELKRAVAGCADARTACYAAAAGDLTAQAACDTTYDGCSASAGKGAEAKLADAAAQCAQQARACRAQASDKQTCKDALKVCVGDDTDDDVDEAVDGGDGDDDEDADEGAADGGKGNSGGSGGGGSNPHSACKSELTTCLDQGGAPKDCAASVRACIGAAGKGEHGKPSGDGGSAHGGQGQAGQGQGGGKPDAGT